MTPKDRAEWLEHQERLYAMAVDKGDTWDLSDNDQAACNAGGNAIMTLLSWSVTDTPQVWQPIETAPKDGRYILTWCRKWKHDVIAQRWLTGSERWSTTYAPTHWMPMPAAPPQEDQ